MAKIILNGIDYSAPTTGAVSGVKGNAEAEYRTGNVNLTPENIGAANKMQAVIEKSLTLASKNSDEAVLLGTYSPDNHQPPLKITVNKLIYEGDTNNGIFQTKGVIRMEGEDASISFDNIDNVGATEIKPKIINTNKLEAHTTNTQYIVNTKNPGIIMDVSELDVKGKVKPMPDNVHNLGESNYRWKQLFAGTSTISTSDRNLKKDIYDLDDKWVEFFMLLHPKSYLFKSGESGRTHVGFISQDVEEALAMCGLTGTDFAGFCKDQKTEKRETQDGMAEDVSVFDEDGNPVYIYSLRYEEFIALNTMMIQKQQNKIKELESRIDIIEKIVF